MRCKFLIRAASWWFSLCQIRCYWYFSQLVGRLFPLTCLINYHEIDAHQCTFSGRDFHLFNSCCLILINKRSGKREFITRTTSGHPHSSVVEIFPSGLAVGFPSKCRIKSQFSIKLMRIAYRTCAFDRQGEFFIQVTPGYLPSTIAKFCSLFF